MATYYINRCETNQTSTGKTVKKLELSQEGKQYPIKNVAIWSDHPRFNEFVVGATLDFEIYEKPSNQINPNTGKPYMDRSVSKFDTPQKAAPQGNVTEMAIKTHIDQKFAALQADLKIIADHLGVEAPKPTVGNTQVEYPEITEDDVPF